MNKLKITDNANRKLAEDGIWGINTGNAVAKFQKAKKLTADKIVGKNTANALGWLYNNK